MPARRFAYNLRHPCLASLLLALGLLLCGCDKGDSDAAKPKSPTEGASPQQLLSQRPQARPAFVAVEPAPKPAALPADASCVTPACHARLATAPHVHGPVSQRACDSCHQPDTGGHRYPLKREGDKTCTFCHTVSGTQEHQHEALKQGCLSCHRPHESNAKFLLKTDTTEQLCATCHAVPLKRYAHGPFAQGQCTVCHQPHQSPSRMLLRGGEGSQHCYTCHTDLRDTMKDSSHVHKPAREDCVTCHSPHSSDYERELKAPIGKNCLSCHPDVGKQMAGATVKHDAMTSDHECANCHTAHASNHASLLKRRMDNSCLVCHAKPVKADGGRIVENIKPALSARFLHGPVQQGECASCHEVHGSTHAQLLKKSFPTSFYTPFAVEKYALCFSCHDQQLVLAPGTTNLTNFRDGDRNLHYVHVNQDTKGRTCKTCHEVHGSNLPRHMASSVPFEGSNWAMPIRYESTPDGGRCAPGCHEPFAYNRKQAVNPTTRTAGAEDKK